MSDSRDTARTTDMDTHTHTAPPPAQQLVEAALDLTKSLKLTEILQQFVDQSCALTGARFGALAVLDTRGGTRMFLQHGFSPEEAHAVGHPPIGRGMIGAIPDDGALIINDIATHPLFTGFPSGHRSMYNFLGVPLAMNGKTFGRLYLADKPGGFDAADVRMLKILGNAAAIAVENARVHTESVSRERWVRASQTITNALLTGVDEDAALEIIADTVRDVSDADTVLIVLPSVGETWACEIATGYMAPTLLGTVMPEGGRAMLTIERRSGLIVESLAHASTLHVPAFKNFGSALYAPLVSRGEAEGVLIILRLPGRDEFNASDLALAEALAQQTAFVLELVSARHVKEIATLLNERDKIGRDLHDFAIQQLFAAGMQLDTARSKICAGELDQSDIETVFDEAIAAVDASVRQIRSIVNELREVDAHCGFVERLRRETSLARASLGFAPSFVVTVDGVAIDITDDCDATMIDAHLDDDIGDDVVAVIREGMSNVARHAKATAVRVTVSFIGLTAINEKTGAAADSTADYAADATTDCARLRVTVCDDGRGIEDTRERSSGLANLEARALRHGGTFDIRKRQRGGGTELVWTIPLHG